MSTSTKTVIWILVIIILAAIGWHYYAASSSANPSTQTSYDSIDNGGPTGSTGDIASSTDTSDAALNQDTAHLDAQMQGLDDDSASADQGINAQ